MLRSLENPFYIAYSFVIVIINQSQNIFLELRADPSQGEVLRFRVLTLKGQPNYKSLIELTARYGRFDPYFVIAR